MVKYQLTDEGLDLFCALATHLEERFMLKGMDKASNFLRKYYLGEAYEQVSS